MSCGPFQSQNLEYFATTKPLMVNGSLSEYLSSCKLLDCAYCTCHLGTKPDGLTCCEDGYPTGKNVVWHSPTPPPSPPYFPFNVQPGQLRQAIILDSCTHSHSPSSRSHRQTQSHKHTFRLWVTQVSTHAASDMWSLSQDREFLC